MKFGSQEGGAFTSNEQLKNAFNQKAMMAAAYKKVHGMKDLPNMLDTPTRHAVVAEWVELHWADTFATLGEADLATKNIDDLLEEIKPEGVEFKEVEEEETMH